LTTSAFPETLYHKTTLPNGLRLITAPMPHTRSVTVSIYVGAGARYETKADAGISHFVEHMCFKGTAKRPTSQEISEAIDGVGGVLNAATDREYTVYYAKVARPHMALALDVLTDLVQSPTFDAVELEKERKVVIEELASVGDSPGQQADMMLDELLWPDQPLGWDIGGTKESVEGITRDMMVDYVRRQYVPSNLVVSVAGNIEQEELLEALAPTLGALPAGHADAWYPAVEPPEKKRFAMLNKRTEQSHVCIGMHGLPLRHPDRYALDLLSVLFGESMSSRLFMELRERMGLCYDVNSYVTHFLDDGAFGIYAAVDPSNAAKTVDALTTELKKLLTGVPVEELNKARELAKGRMLLRLEDTRAVSGWLGGQEILNGTILSPEDVVASLESVTVADLHRVVEHLLAPESLHMAIVGPHRSDKRFLPALDV
jgi:predicted Zn-dependent peptidase